MWFRKFPWIERTLLNGYFKALGKKLLFTAHNVDDVARDGRKNTVVNRLSLKFMYRTVDHIFVHTPEMKLELVREFGVAEQNVTVIPFGINNVIPVSPMSRLAARRALGLADDARILLFFGNIVPYKGIEDLIKAGVIDPVKVSRTALQNAASIAGLMLTTKALVSEIPEGEKARVMYGR